MKVNAVQTVRGQDWGGQEHRLIGVKVHRKVSANNGQGLSGPAEHLPPHCFLLSVAVSSKTELDEREVPSFRLKSGKLFFFCS